MKPFVDICPGESERFTVCRGFYTVDNEDYNSVVSFDHFNSYPSNVENESSIWKFLIFEYKNLIMMEIDIIKNSVPYFESRNRLKDWVTEWLDKNVGKNKWKVHSQQNSNHSFNIFFKKYKDAIFFAKEISKEWRKENNDAIDG